MLPPQRIYHSLDRSNGPLKGRRAYRLLLVVVGKVGGSNAGEGAFLALFLPLREPRNGAGGAGEVVNLLAGRFVTVVFVQADEELVVAAPEQ